MVKYYGRARQRIGSVNTNQPGLKQAGCPGTVGKKGLIIQYLGKRVNCNLKTCGLPMSGLRCRYGVGDAIGRDKTFMDIQNSNNPAIKDYCKEVIGGQNGVYCQWPQPRNRQNAGGVGHIWTSRRNHCEKTCSLGWKENYMSNHTPKEFVQQVERAAVAPICTIPSAREAGSIDYRHAILEKEYGTQRVFVEALSAEGYFASVLVDIMSPTALTKSYPWECGDWRLAILAVTWFDDQTQKMEQYSANTIEDFNGKWEHSFKVNNSNVTAEWSVSPQGTGKFTVTTFSQIFPISLTVSNITLIPQGIDGTGFVPDPDAYSFSCLNSKIEGQIGTVKLSADNSVSYVESVITTPPAKPPACCENFVCIYILQPYTNTNKSTLFICGIPGATLQPSGARGMMITNGKGTWLTSHDFTLNAIGPQYYSQNAGTFFYTSYEVKLLPYNITLTLRNTNPTIDFGSVTGGLRRWTQEVAVENPPQKFQGSRGLLEVEKSL